MGCLLFLTFNARMEDAKTKPNCIMIERGQVIYIKHHLGLGAAITSTTAAITTVIWCGVWHISILNPLKKRIETKIPLYPLSFIFFAFLPPFNLWSFLLTARAHQFLKRNPRDFSRLRLFLDSQNLSLSFPVDLLLFLSLFSPLFLFTVFLLQAEEKLGAFWGRMAKLV